MRSWPGPSAADRRRCWRHGDEAADRPTPPGVSGPRELDPPRAGAKRRFVVDLAPLRESRQFRLMFWGQAVSIIGRQFTVVAASFEVYQLTHSTLMVGVLSLAQLGPLLVFSLLGGSLADAMDRRRLLLIVQVFMAATS